MKKLIILSTLSVGFLFGCDDWIDVNQDPNNPTTVTPDLVLPVAQHFTAVHMQEDRGVNHLGNMFMYNWSESAGFSWYNDEFLYLVTSTFYDQIFDYAYSNALNQYEVLNTYGDDYMAYKGIAEIMKAYHFQILVDFYGDVPYFDALKRGGTATPAYDDAQAIYDDLIIKLTAAIEMINTAEADETSVVPGDDDAMFAGDLTAWKQFANTIKLRILTRESDVKDVAYITAELAVIATEGSGYITSDVLINPGYTNQTGLQNPFWESFGRNVAGTVTLTNDATCATDYILSYLQSNTDPRVDLLYEEPGTGHLGVPQGITSDPDTQGADQVSNIGPGLLIGADQDAVIMTLAESYFNLAELAVKGFTVGDAETLYNSGVQASFDFLGAPGFAAYIAQPINNVSYADSPNKLEAIITQKWIATNGLTAEQAWFDWSRTGFPSGLPVSVEQPGLTRPVRLAYPASEVGGNAANLPDQPNVFTTRIFWAN